jgi:hypothetical protein
MYIQSVQKFYTAGICNIRPEVYINLSPVRKRDFPHLEASHTDSVHLYFFMKSLIEHRLFLATCVKLEEQLHMYCIQTS